MHILEVLKKGRIVPMILAASIASAGCTASSTAHMSPTEIIQDDLQKIYPEAGVYKLSLEDAIDRALEYNLDARIAESDYAVALSDADLQKLNGLPSLTAKADFLTRNNDGAGSSQSTITGTQSLEPSISTEPTRFTSLLEMNWNVLDSALNIYRSKTAIDRAIIAEERARKVRQNIIMDVYSAFWRTAVSRQMGDRMDVLLADVDTQLASLEAAREAGDLNQSSIHSAEVALMQKRANLISMYEDFALAEIELKALVSYPLDKPLALIYQDDIFNFNSFMSVKGSAEEFVDFALKKRPEIAEELLNKRIAERDVKLQIYETIPGLNLLVSGNYDQNKFLVDNRWLSLTASLTQNINNIITFSTRYERAKRQVDLADSRRRALVAAVAAQVYIAKTLHNGANRRHLAQKAIADKYTAEAKRLERRRDVGLTGGLDYVTMSMDAMLAELNSLNTAAEVHSTFARFANSIGFDYSDYKRLDLFALSQGDVRGANG